MIEHRYANMEQLSAIADKLDMCRRQESYYKSPLTGDYTRDMRRMDIVNLNADTGGRSAVVSSIYREYQHKDVITQIAESFTHAKIEGHGSVYNNGDRIMCSTFFDNVELLRDPTSQKGIKVGAMFKNSYNKMNSVTGSGYFLRMECLNQMHFGNLIKEMKFSERHTGGIIEALPQSISDFTDALVLRSKLVATQCKIAAEVPVKFTDREQRLQTMQALVAHPKVGAVIDAHLEKLNSSLTVTKWDVYNSITEVTSHERMGDTVREKIDKFSERLLSPDYTIIPSLVMR